MRKMPGMEHHEDNSIALAPGATGHLAWTFTRAGTFQYACLIPGHFEAEHARNHHGRALAFSDAREDAGRSHVRMRRPGGVRRLLRRSKPHSPRSARGTAHDRRRADRPRHPRAALGARQILRRPRRSADRRGGRDLPQDALSRRSREARAAGRRCGAGAPAPRDRRGHGDPRQDRLRRARSRASRSSRRSLVRSRHASRPGLRRHGDDDGPGAASRRHRRRGASVSGRLRGDRGGAGSRPRHFVHLSWAWCAPACTQSTTASMSGWSSPAAQQACASPRAKRRIVFSACGSRSAAVVFPARS